MHDSVPQYMPSANAEAMIARSLQLAGAVSHPNRATHGDSAPDDDADEIAEERMASGARWEWRTFGAGADAGAPAFEGRVPSGMADSDEQLPPLGRRHDRQDPRRADGREGAARRRRSTGSSSGARCSRWRSRSTARRFAPSGRRCGCQPPTLARDAYTADQLEAELTGSGDRRARRRGPQAPGPLRDRRLHVGAHRRRRRWPDDPDDRRRDRGSGAGARCGPDAGSRGLPQHRVPARPRRAARRRRAALRGHRRRHELDQVPCGGTRRRRASGPSSTAPSSPGSGRAWRRVAW